MLYKSVMYLNPEHYETLVITFQKRLYQSRIDIIEDEESPSLTSDFAVKFITVLLPMQQGIPVLLEYFLQSFFFFWIRKSSSVLEI